MTERGNMREILFKAKRIDNGEWVEGSLLQTTAVSLKSFIVTSSCYTFDKWDWNECVQVDTETICQYTGLTDKNGCKIWEGDVVKKYNSNGDEWKISKIIWADYSLNMGWCIEDIKSLTEYSGRLFKVGFDVNDTEKCEVIGNIFDNSDLLDS